MKFIFCIQINIEYYNWMNITRHAQSTQNKFAYFCNISIKAWEMKLSFCLEINTKVFYKMVITLNLISQTAQSTKNNPFTISLQYLKENMKDEVDFLPADKCWRFFQIDTIILGVCGQACPNYLAIYKFANSRQHVKKGVSGAVYFLHAYKHESVLWIDNKIFWWVWSSIPAVPKKASL